MMELRRVTFELLGFQYRRLTEEREKAYSHHQMGWRSVELLEWVGIPVCPGQEDINLVNGGSRMVDTKVKLAGSLRGAQEESIVSRLLRGAKDDGWGG
jgi:hypothetical protein